MESKAEGHDILDKYPSLTDGIGKLKNYQQKLHVEPEVKSVVQPHRHVAFFRREQVSAELKRLEDSDIIECL